MKMVDEDENGAFLGVRPEFLEKFDVKENNPNFEVYDSSDGINRFVVVKASRLPDDGDPESGKFGINFHRARPNFKDAKAYYKELTTARISRQSLNGLAFAAMTKADYDNKSAAWQRFYTYIWGKTPQTIWVTPHSGNVERAADNIFPYPKLEMDAYAAGVTAWCAMQDTGPTLMRRMISIHSHNWYSAVVDLGGFGIISQNILESAAAIIEEKYAEKVQPAAEACRRHFMAKVIPWLEHIWRTKGTLNLGELPPEYGIERSVIYYVTTGLKLYKKEIKHFTLEELKEVIQSLHNTRIKVASCNHLFPGQQIGRQLELSAQINRGLLDSALQIECMKHYLKRASELVADIIRDVKRELFG